MPNSSLKKKSHCTKRRGKGSKRNKSRKIRCRARARAPSLSASYHNDTASTTSSMSASSEECPRTSSRSLTRKASKKKRSLTSDSNQEAHRSRKRKRSNKRGEDGDGDRARNSVLKKKKKKKKRSRRDVSVTESWTSQGISSGDESEFSKKRARKAREGGEKGTSKLRNLPSSSRTSDSCGYQSGENKVKYTRQDMYANDIARQDEKASPLYFGNDTRKHTRSRSCSPLSRSIGCSSYQSEDKVMKVNNVRKLRSVITVVRREEENVGMSEGGDLKEVLLLDRDCYQSSRTNRTGNSMETRQISESKRHADDGQGQTIITSVVETVSNIKEIWTADGGDEKGNFQKERETEVSSSLGSLNGDDIESILRQRALENLRKFRGGKQTNVNKSATQEDGKDGALKKPYSFKDESFLISCKEDDAGAGSAVQAAEQLRQPIAWKGAPAPMLSNSQNTPGDNGISQELGAPLHEGSSLDSNNLCQDPKEKLNTAVDAGPNELPTSSFEQRSDGMRTKSLHIPTAEEHYAANLATGSTGNERPSGTSESDISDKVNRVPGSAVLQTAHLSTSGDSMSENLQRETKESSEFEQKTMSVMRGGEMVQVSYKVYIPKKAPGLARRQLKR